MDESRNVLGGRLEACSGDDPITGFYRDGCCNTGPDDIGSHTVCTVLSEEFLTHQKSVGNDLSTPRPEYGFAGSNPATGGGSACHDGAGPTTPVSPGQWSSPQPTLVHSS